MDRIQKPSTCVLYFHSYNHFMMVAAEDRSKYMAQCGSFFGGYWQDDCCLVALCYNMTVVNSKTDVLMVCTGFVCAPLCSGPVLLNCMWYCAHSSVLLCSISVPSKILWHIVFCHSEYTVLNYCI